MFIHITLIPLNHIQTYFTNLINFSKKMRKETTRNQGRPCMKSISDIKNAPEGTDFGQWYFNAWVLTHPETIIVQQEIRQVFFVFDERKPQEVLVVILCEAAVRRYCNILKPFNHFQFVNTLIKISQFDNNFVFVAEKSRIIHIEGQYQQRSKSSSVIQKIFATKNNLMKRQNAQNPKKYTTSLCLPNNSPEEEFDSSQSFEYSDKSNQGKPKAMSQRIAYTSRQQESMEELVNFCGTVIAMYQVGKGRMNHGLGYRIEQCFSKATYQVVIWCEMQWSQLKKGRTYEFSRFRVHKKHNLDVSYHSHPQYSSIKQLY